MGARFRLGRPTERARNLRNEPTLHEELLWRQLKGGRLNGLKFSRQMPIAGYFGDFVCRAKRLVVELDGSQHAGADAYDVERTSALERVGYRVIRFWNNDLTSNMDGVLETIANVAGVAGREPTPTPPASGRGEEAGALLAAAYEPLPPIPRRAPQPHPAFGADRPHHQAAKGGPGVPRLLPVPQREVAQLLRQRRQGLLPLLWLRRAWRRDPLDDRPARPAVHGCGQGTGPGRGHGNAGDGPARRPRRRSRPRVSTMR